jgi:hypothetical protein
MSATIHTASDSSGRTALGNKRRWKASITVDFLFYLYTGGIASSFLKAADR